MTQPNGAPAETTARTEHIAHLVEGFAQADLHAECSCGWIGQPVPVTPDSTLGKRRQDALADFATHVHVAVGWAVPDGAEMTQTPPAPAVVDAEPRTAPGAGEASDALTVAAEAAARAYVGPLVGDPGTVSDLAITAWAVGPAWRAAIAAALATARPDPLAVDEIKAQLDKALRTNRMVVLPSGVTIPIKEYGQMAAVVETARTLVADWKMAHPDAAGLRPVQRALAAAVDALDGDGRG